MPFDIASFESAFAAASGPAGRERSGTAGAGKPSKPVTTKALDPKRSNAVAIMMSSLPPISQVMALTPTLTLPPVSQVMALPARLSPHQRGGTPQPSPRPAPSPHPSPPPPGLPRLRR